MPSRINIGPENGPYVAINESSGNLQLEDNSGNVVAEWDETNTQWDFANNTLNNVDALNSNSVSAEQLDIGESITVIFADETGQSIPNETVTQVEFDSTHKDDLDYANLNEDQIDIGRSGNYLINAAFTFDQLDTASRIFSAVRVNDLFGPGIIDYSSSHAGLRSTASVSGIRQLESGDELSLVVNHESGESETVRDELRATRLSIAKVG